MHYRPRLKEQMEYCMSHPDELTKVAAVQKRVSFLLSPRLGCPTTSSKALNPAAEHIQEAPSFTSFTASELKKD